MGESAGSVVLSQNIEYIKEMDDFTAAPHLDSFSALGLVDFYPLPHYTNFPFQEAVENIISNYAEQLDLRPFSNTKAIVVTENKIEVLNK